MPPPSISTIPSEAGKYSTIPSGKRRFYGRVRQGLYERLWLRALCGVRVGVGVAWRVAWGVACAAVAGAVFHGYRPREELCM